MKKIISILLFLSACCSVFAATGLMSGQKNIRYVQTQYFDIIYAEQSEMSAAILAENADDIYLEICQQQDAQPYFRMPVVISPATDVFNAYYTNLPYNRIVLYDTSAEADMLVFKEQFLGTFRHELTHAVTINMTSDSIKNIKEALGDSFLVGHYLMNPPLLTEGTAVASESRSGYGRMNDGFFLHTVRQSKLDDRFPSWKDVSGAADVYPGKSASYSFGGPFVTWLQDTYGMEKYSQWMYKSNSAEKIFLDSTFYSIYEKHLDDLWNEFKESIIVPEIESNPLTTEYVSDFFDENSQNFSRQNQLGGRFYYLTNCENGFAYVDYTSKIVWYKDIRKSSAEKLFVKGGITKLNFSSDGKFLAVSYEESNGANYSTKVSVYNLASKKFFNINEQSLRDATLLKKNDEYYLCAASTLSQQITLKLYRLNLNSKSEIQNYELKDELKFSFGKYVQNFCALNDDLFATNFSDGKFSLVSYKNISEKGFADKIEWNLDSLNTESENIHLRSLSSSSKNRIYFSYAYKSTLPRIGYLDLNTNQILLSNQDISGGIYYPVELNDEIYYSGYFVDSWKLFKINEQKMSDTFNVKEVAAEVVTENKSEKIKAATAEDNSIQFDSTKILKDAKAFNQMLFYDGTWFPVSILQMTDVQLSSAFYLPLGVTYATSDPWNSNVLLLTAGYDYYTNNFGFGAQYSFLVPTSSIAFNSVYGLIFEPEGFRQTYDMSDFSFKYYFGNCGYLTLSDSNILFAGKQQTYSNYTGLLNDWKSKFGTVSFFDWIALLNGYVQETDENKYFYEGNQASVKLGMSFHTGDGKYETFAAQLSATYYGLFLSSLDQSFEPQTFQLISPSVVVKFPKLIPVDCPYRITYNLPFALQFSFVPSSKKFLYAQSQILLFSSEIQKGTKFLPLYNNRIQIAAGYQGYLAQDNVTYDIYNCMYQWQNISQMTYNDCVNMEVDLVVSYNQGALAGTSLTLTLGVQYYLRATSDNTGIYFSSKLLF